MYDIAKQLTVLLLLTSFAACAETALYPSDPGLDKQSIDDTDQEAREEARSLTKKVAARMAGDGCVGAMIELSSAIERKRNSVFTSELRRLNRDRSARCVRQLVNDNIQNHSMNVALTIAESSYVVALVDPKARAQIVDGITAAQIEEKRQAVHKSEDDAFQQKLQQTLVGGDERKRKWINGREAERRSDPQTSKNALLAWGGVACSGTKAVQDSF
jgi:hypothetical protein